jgi:peptidyl-prolyl cis-trans isomerase A (cyclophilin A)
MLLTLGRLLYLFCLLASLSAYAANPQVEFETSRGNFVIELYPDKAPRTVENFLQYVRSGFYDGTVFHRAINHFVVQGGGLTEKLDPKQTREPVPNESTNGLSNDYGTVAMARGYKPDSATSQFFVNLEDNRFLNYYRSEAGLEGYTVFGRVIRGLDVLIKLSEVQTAAVGRLDHVPKELTVIRASRLLEMPVLAENVPPLKEPEPIDKKSQTSKSSKKGKKRG